MNKFIIITTITGPTKGIKKFAKLSDWHLVVVGDNKTPDEYESENIDYLSPKKQIKLYKKFAENLPWNSYSRKNLGYLYAIENGADVIAESDNDNIPKRNWGNNLSFEGEFNTVSGLGFVNMYKYFTKKLIWPRGYPLEKVSEKTENKTKPKKNKIGIWQYLVDKEPDVDAVYRLVLNNKVKFYKDLHFVLDKNVVCPINTQNTFFTKEMFPLLFLPPYVSMRFIDILRGLVAQPIMWNYGYKVGFGSPNAYQERNFHNLLKDFEMEVPVYLNAEKIINIAQESIQHGDTMSENLVRVYKDLHKAKIIQKEILISLKLWLRELDRI